jgi:hypothetical protein
MTIHRDHDVGGIANLPVVYAAAPDVSPTDDLPDDVVPGSYAGLTGP